MGEEKKEKYVNAADAVNEFYNISKLTRFLTDVSEHSHGMTLGGIVFADFTSHVFVMLPQQFELFFPNLADDKINVCGMIFVKYKEDNKWALQ